MITLKVVTYLVDETVDDLFSRISWQVERSEKLTSFWNNTTVDTTKPWVGRVSAAFRTFKIIATNSHVILPLRVFDGNFFDIYIEGEAKPTGKKLEVEVSFRVGLQTSLMLILLSFIVVMSLTNFFLPSDPRYSGALIWSLAFVGCPVALLTYQLQRLKRKVARLLGAVSV